MFPYEQLGQSSHSEIPEVKVIEAASKTTYSIFLGLKKNQTTFIMFVWLSSHTHHGLKYKMWPAGEDSKDPWGYHTVQNRL